MPASLEPSGFLAVGDASLEYRFLGPPPSEAPTIVMLHEGLGCVGLWRDFPERLASMTGAGVFLYSRAGYGQSSPVPLPRSLDYMHEEAWHVLPTVLDLIGLRRGILLGHSDGASIAAIHAGEFADPRVEALVLIAPHFVVEDMTAASIAEAKRAYETGGLRARLCRWHRDVDNAFWGWNRAWLDPAFRRWNITAFLPRIRVPVLVLQGTEDPYGTALQVEIAERQCGGPVEVAWIEGAGHDPAREKPEETLENIAAFVRRMLKGPA